MLFQLVLGTPLGFHPGCVAPCYILSTSPHVTVMTAIAIQHHAARIVGHLDWRPARCGASSRPGQGC